MEISRSSIGTITICLLERGGPQSGGVSRGEGGSTVPTDLYTTVFQQICIQLYSNEACHCTSPQAL